MVEEKQIVELARLLGRYSETVARESSLLNDLTDVVRGIIGSLMVEPEVLPGIETDDNLGPCDLDDPEAVKERIEKIYDLAERKRADEETPVDVINLPHIGDSEPITNERLIESARPRQRKKYSKNGLILIWTFTDVLRKVMPLVSVKDVLAACEELGIKCVTTEGNKTYINYKLIGVVRDYIETKYRRDDYGE